MRSSFSTEERKTMTDKSMYIRGAVLIAAIAVTTVAMASPLTIPPLPKTNGSGNVMLAASPLTIPPLPKTKGNVAA
jgi:hypothetical protein